MAIDPFAPIGSGTGKASPARNGDWEIVVPVPPDTKAAPKHHPKLGKPSAVWAYTDAKGELLGYVCRFDGTNGKEFRPLTWWRSKSGPPAWRWTSWPPKRPLYGLARLAERPFAPVVVTEGEKACDAAARLLRPFVTVTSTNGSKSADKADWSPLKGRAVTIWPDADAAGLAFARAVAKAAGEAGAASIAIVAPPEGVAVGWDAADALSAGWDDTRAAALVAAAVPFKEDEAPRSRRKRQRDDVIGAIVNTEGVELWRDQSGATYATVPVVGTHLENWSLRAFGFERWVSGFYYRKSGVALSTQALDDIRRTLDIKAYEEGSQYDPFVRVGSRNGKIYLDLCDDAWRAVEITAKGWRIINRPAVKFLRSASALALPEPDAGDVIERLRGFVNVASEDDFKLLVSWIVAALRPGSPFPILIVNGTQGTGKSVLCRLLRSLVDPDVALICAVPKDERDLVLAASNTWVSAFDNLSDVSGFLPDALCRLASGAGFRTRALHTNRDESVFSVQRPVLLNGIPTLTEQADVARRAVVINLETIPPERRQAESDFWVDFASVKGRILGVLLDGVSRALSAIDSIQVDRPGSMADFEKWAMAAAPAFGWKAEEFQAAYRRNQTLVVDDTFEADAVAVAIRDLIMPRHVDGWEGTPAALQAELDEVTPERIRKSRSWPKTPAQLGNRIKRAKPLLEHKGFTVDRRHSGTRTIIIVPPRAQPGGAT